MDAKLEGTDESLWVGTTPQTNYSALKNDTALYDVAIVGGGITGIVLAYFLQQGGHKVVVVEKGRIVEWTTGGTTAKLTSQHYLIYNYLIKRHGTLTAAAYAQANQSGIDEVEHLSNELGIPCDFARRDAYVFTGEAAKVDAIKAEVAAAQSLGLPASFETSVDLPFTITGAIKFSNQAQFHPRKFLLGLAKRFVAAGGVLYENTVATDINPGDPNVLITKQGELRAKHIVQASGEPFWNKRIFDGRMWTKMSYALAVTLKDPATYPKNMYITTDAPLRTIRTAEYDGGKVMVFGGESHEYDDATYNPDACYKDLILDVRKRFDVEKVLYRWLAGDYMPYDRIPFIGAMPGYPTIYTVTGYRAWGLAWAMSAAHIIVGEIAGKPLVWAMPFTLDRLSDPLREGDINGSKL